MPNQAFVAGITLWRGDGGSPQSFAQVCQVFGISGLGQTNALVDATTFCSNGFNEYVAGLADGSEVTFQCNYETVQPNVQILIDMIGDVKNKATRSFELRALGDITAPTTVKQTFHFDATCISWIMAPDSKGKNTISFAVKVTGNIDVTQP